MNSAYGFFGASRGFLPVVPIAASITAVGRQMIMDTVRKVEALVPGSEVVYGDTDSVMVKLKLPNGDRSVPEHFKVGQWLAETITRDLKPPNVLEHEKVFLPYVLYTRKRYAAIKYESLDDPGKRDVKGLAVVRRDNCPLLKSVLGECLDTILLKKDAQLALEVARKHVLSVLDNERDMADFVVSKTLKTGYKVDAQPHVHVARKIEQRRGYPVPSGSRVPYVLIEDVDQPDQKQALKAEDPEYAKQHGLVPDRRYYIEHQIHKPLKSLLEPLVADPMAEIFDHPTIKPKWDALTHKHKADVAVAQRKRKNEMRKQPEITRWFKPA